jgi:hypothetical protein
VEVGRGRLGTLTGKLSRFTLAGQASAIGYTFPDGLNILGVRESDGKWTLARYSLTGALTKVLIRDTAAFTGIYSSDGQRLHTCAVVEHQHDPRLLVQPAPALAGTGQRLEADRADAGAQGVCP